MTTASMLATWAALLRMGFTPRSAAIIVREIAGRA